MAGKNLAREFPKETNGIEDLLKDNKKKEAFQKASSYVINLSRKFYVRGLEREDIENEALYALWQAIESYDISRGLKFKTFMGKVVINRMMELIRSMTRDKRDDTLASNSDLAKAFSSYTKPQVDIKLDMEYFITRTLSMKHAPFWKESLRCGSFADAGRNLGYTKNETRHLRDVIIKKAREALGTL